MSHGPHVPRSTSFTTGAKVWEPAKVMISCGCGRVICLRSACNARVGAQIGESKERGDTAADAGWDGGSSTGCPASRRYISCTSLHSLLCLLMHCNSGLNIGYWIAWHCLALLCTGFRQEGREFSSLCRRCRNLGNPTGHPTCRIHLFSSFSSVFYELESWSWLPVKSNLPQYINKPQKLEVNTGFDSRLHVQQHCGADQLEEKLFVRFHW